MNSPGSEQKTADGQVQCKLCHKTFPSGAGWLCSDCNGELVPLGDDPLIGTYIDKRYEILGRLGEGGMSTVYKARHRYMDRIVAVKLLKEDLATDPLASQRFQQEAKAASALTHQNVVTVHEFGMMPSGQAYFVMDCLEGESLDDVIEREGRVSIARAVDIFRQICDGLEPAHKMGLVHRDLKPSNIVLLKQPDESELVKIVDFGIAKFLPRDGAQQQMRLTQTGEVFGSPLYMSPEQCQGQTLDTRSDIYSLGCLMYETLTGEPVFVGDNFLNIAVQHMNAPPPPFRQSCPEALIPAPLEEVVMKCLAKEPMNRFQKVAEIRQALLDAALVSGVKGIKAGGVPDPGPRSGVKHTFDKFKISLSRAAAVTAKQPIMAARRVLVGSLVAIGLLTIGVLVFWQGPSGDSGTPLQKMRWQFNVVMAQQAEDSGDLKKATQFLLNAKEIATHFGDGQDRLRFTYTQLADVYGKAGMFDDQQSALKTADDIVAAQFLARVQHTTERLKEIAARPRKIPDGIAKSQALANAQLEAQARAADIVADAGRLGARGLYEQEESFLWKAIDTFNDLGLHDAPDMARLKSSLADCYIQTQDLQAVRQLLLDVLAIREKLPTPHTPQQGNYLIKAYLRLGEFDRDQSNFENAKTEFGKALDLIKQHFGNDNALMLEYLNGYADLMRQMGNIEEQHKYMDLANKQSKRANK